MYTNKGQTKQAGNAHFLKLVIVLNMSVNHSSLLESTFYADKRVISHPCEHTNLLISERYARVLGYNWRSFLSFLFSRVGAFSIVLSA